MNFNNVLNRLKNNYVLKKNKSFYIKDKDSNIEKDLDITKYLKYNTKYNDVLYRFNQIFDEKINKSNKANFLNNIEDLKIKGKTTYLLTSPVSGSYSSEKNKITIYNKYNDKKIDISERLMHELLHMASRKKNGLEDGLTKATKTSNGYIVFGTAINEGYTELLNQKYFTTNYNRQYYTKERVLASGIERIVGKNNMENNYFTGSLIELLKELQKNCGGDENYYLNLLHKMDLLHKQRNYYAREEMYKDLKKNISTLNSIKLEQQFNKNLISEEEYYKKYLLNVKLYEEYDFIYDDKVNIIDNTSSYTFEGCFGSLTIAKEEIISNLINESDKKTNTNKKR